MIGRLIGIARRSRKRAAMEELERTSISRETGLEGDWRGRFAKRAVTILTREAWSAALADLAGAPDLPWTFRRANLLVEGIDLPRTVGMRLQIGGALLEVTGEAEPCARMEEQHAGLMAALSPDWRAGFIVRVLASGQVALGDEVRLLQRGDAAA